MNVELNALRARYGRMLVTLLWAHVPVIGLAARWVGGMSPLVAMTAAAVLAAIYQLTWHWKRTAPVTRNIAAVVLVAEPALFLLVFEGHAWQMDMHMYFYAVLALSLAWFDRAALMISAAAITVHHLVLFYVLPGAVFSSDGDLGRVLLHGAIVAFQTIVLIWVSDKVVQSFDRIGRMSDEIVAKSAALEERTREAEEANRTKSMFLANMSHEIRTPINAILGFCHLVQRTPLEPRQREHVSRISTAGGVLLRLINDLLDFSKNEAGALTLESWPFDLRSALSCQVQLVAETMAARNLTLRQDLSPDLPEVVVGDELRLNQVLLNLLSNATKFSRDGEIVLSARLAERDGDTARIEVSLRDCGIGITPDQMARLFTPFTQADSSTTRRFGGTGLGLAICRQIVEQMDGWIRADSTPDQGSTFTFSVRLAVGDAALADSALPCTAIRALRILITDDSPIALKMLEEAFARWQMRVTVAASGRAALDMISAADQRGSGYDLLILDWKMPDMDGLQTLRALRGMGLRRVPAAMVMTAHGVDAVMHEAAGERIDLFLAKPINARSLMDALRQLPGLAERHLAASAVDMPVTEAPPQVLAGRHVLLVEDNPINREIAMALLADAGLQVDCAENGLIACQMIEAGTVDYGAVLMDMQMPEMDGLTATRRIRRTHSPQDLPIIALTAHAYDSERQACLEAGMCDHLTKPVDPVQLVTVLARHIRPARVAPLPPVAPAPIAADGALPDMLPPFDIPAALMRVNGKRALLRRLILSFAQGNRDAVVQIRRLVAEGRTEDAHRAAHTLKGVAASLELPDVATLAGRIEAALAQPDGQALDPMLDALDAALWPAIAAADSLSQPAAPTAPPQAQAPADPALLGQLRSQLHDQVRRRSMAARGAFDALAEALQLDPASRGDHPLRQALLRLDYAAADALLDTIPTDHRQPRS
ncbi:MAG: response regulator [Paracoccus hibiscisoli]|uniref:response regulator n=1 Tax=Paracoccus hibiscisoli TaxID=2023261 RepID=UPI00391AFA62